MPTIQDLTTPLRRETDHLRFIGSLRQAAEAAHDRVMPMSSLSFSPDAKTVVIARADGEPLLLATGVADSIEAAPLRSAVRQIAERLSIPIRYLDMLRDDVRPQLNLLASNNLNVLGAFDERPALFRLWQASDGWALRAVLSDKYRAMGSYEALQSVVQGMTTAGVNLGDCEIDVDLTPDKFRMRIAVPQISLLVPDLLGGYRTPFSQNPNDPTHARSRDAEGEVPPVIWAGLEITNSETGQGSHTITPRAVVQICRNGLTRSIDAIRNVHLGQRLDEGVIDWSVETRRLQAELLSQQVADAVGTFCSVDYLTRQADEMRAAKGMEVTSPTAAIDTVRTRFEFTEAEHDSILDAFLRSGDTSVLGVGQAVTAAATYAESGDRQAEMESKFWEIVGSPAAFAGR